VEQFGKRGIAINRKVYFNVDPGVTEKHEILITSFDAGETTVSSPPPLKVLSEALPDAGAGLGPPYKVMVHDQTGGNQ